MSAMTGFPAGQFGGPMRRVGGGWGQMFGDFLWQLSVVWQMSILRRVHTRLDDASRTRTSYPRLSCASGDGPGFQCADRDEWPAADAPSRPSGDSPARPGPARASRIRHRPPLPQQPRQHHTGAAGIKKPPGRPDAVIVVVINAASTC